MTIHFKLSRAWALGALLCAIVPARTDAAPPEIDLTTLLKSETDIAQLPDLNHWTSHMFSSCEQQGANNDQGHYLSEQGAEHVMAEMDGPGAIVRIWSANPKGTIQIYLDGSKTPVVGADFSSLFNEAYAPFAAPLAGISSGGAYSYLPIPYARHCRVVSRNNDADATSMYYQVNYISFPKDTKVRSFALPLSRTDQIAVDRANIQWSTLSASLLDLPALPATERIAPHATLALGSYKGPGRVNVIRLAAPDAADLNLRRLVLRAYFDGHQTPDIEAPVADFFGNAYAHNKTFRTLFLAVAPDGSMLAYFPMPFARTARFELENGNSTPLQIGWTAQVASGAFDGKQEGYFHALWSQEITETGKPHSWAHIAGQRGKFVGVVQTMASRHGIGFIEGDEQFRSDSQTWTPAKNGLATVVGPWNGTGTEDGFNSAWSFNTGPNCLPMNGLFVKNEDAGQLNCFRWFVNEAPVFEKSLDGQIEHGPGNDTPGVYYSSVSYWYSDGPATPWAKFPDADQIALPRVAPIHPSVANAIEGEALTGSTRVSAGQLRTQSMLDFDSVWSDDSQLIWVGQAAGDTLTLTFSAPKAGAYDVSLSLTKANDYGQAAFQINGQTVGGVFDGYSDKVVSSGPVTLGRIQLPAGPSELTVVVPGKNAASANYQFGLDAIVLDPVR